MELQIQVEKPSNIVRKLTIRVPAKEVANRFQRGLVEVQRTAKLKGFRPGHAPLTVIKQFYGEDIRHRLYHNLVDESFREAVRQEKLPTVGRPQIESPEHKHGEGEHDHAAHEDKDFTYTATVEVMPEIEVKGYAGLALKKDSAEVTAEQVDAAIKNMLDSQAELVPASGGLVGADGKPSSRPAKKGDYVDMSFDGGLVTDKGVEKKDGMKGSRLLEIGSEQLIEGFEDQLVGMRAGETKTFRIPFPKDYFDKDLAGKESEFTVTVSEVKEKKLPELNDEFAKSVGYESVADLKAKANEHLTRERTTEVERKLQNDLIEAIIEKNTFEVPKSLVEGQTRALAQDLAQNLKQQGMDDAMIQQAIMSEIENLRKRAETQVRASLLLESIAKKEGIEVKEEDYEAELKGMAASMKVDFEKVRDFYAKEPGRKEDVLFRVRQERTVKLLLDKAKIKSS
ncbi:MAG: trigger factor [Oligoflexia bacterium]|nr:trigger factor [Oligoflexia bacterium]